MGSTGRPRARSPACDRESGDATRLGFPRPSPPPLSPLPPLPISAHPPAFPFRNPTRLHLCLCLCHHLSALRAHSSCSMRQPMASKNGYAQSGSATAAHSCSQPRAAASRSGADACVAGFNGWRRRDAELPGCVPVLLAVSIQLRLQIGPRWPSRRSPVIPFGVLVRGCSGPRIRLPYSGLNLHIP